MFQVFETEGVDGYRVPRREARRLDDLNRAGTRPGIDFSAVFTRTSVTGVGGALSPILPPRANPHIPRFGDMFGGLSNLPFDRLGHLETGLARASESVLPSLTRLSAVLECEA